MTALFLLPNDVITDHKSTPSYPLIFPLLLFLCQSIFILLFLSLMISADNK